MPRRNPRADDRALQPPTASASARLTADARRLVRALRLFFPLSRQPVKSLPPKSASLGKCQQCRPPTPPCLSTPRKSGAPRNLTSGAPSFRCGSIYSTFRDWRGCVVFFTLFVLALEQLGAASSLSTVFLPVLVRRYRIPPAPRELQTSRRLLVNVDALERTSVVSVSVDSSRVVCGSAPRWVF